MCGRFTLTPMDVDAIAEGLGVPVEQLKMFKPRYNIAPTSRHFVVAMPFEDREVIPARWGLVNSWARDASTAARQINARADTVDVRPAFRGAFKKRRCIVPADGFFEWTGPREARQPIWFRPPDGSLLLFAGLYESWQSAPGVFEPTFTIITTGANRLVEPVHDRMPVILTQEAADEWMDPRHKDFEVLKGLLVPAPDDLLVARRVSPLVNSTRNDSPEILLEQPALIPG
jgi:putative SOS response-associated peptidase YedK